LTTDAFLAALDRFIARRGVPAHVYSDCGTNYVGAARKLKYLFRNKDDQAQISARVACNWHFNPSAVPHFGGLWEARIKSVKFHLKRVIGTQVLTYEELETLCDTAAPSPCYQSLSRRYQVVHTLLYFFHYCLPFVFKDGQYESIERFGSFGSGHSKDPFI